MKLLLDENLPKKLKYRFSDIHEVITVPEMGWNGIKNGELLRQMDANEMNVLITLDKNMSRQQNLLLFKITLIVLNARDSRYASLLALVPAIEKEISKEVVPGIIEIA